MLTEQYKDREIGAVACRRRFSDQSFDLTVKYDEANCLSGFTLRFEFQGVATSISWDMKNGYSRPHASLMAWGLSGFKSLAESFKAASESIDDKISNLVYQKLIEWGQLA